MLPLSRSKKKYISRSLRTLAYAKNIRKCPPPLFHVIISCLQILVFTLDKLKIKQVDNLIFYW